MRNHKRIFLTKVFAEIFSKSDRVPRRHTNNIELAKSRKFSQVAAPYSIAFNTAPALTNCKKTFVSNAKKQRA